ncbi:MAG: gliding motility lipoprotein GldB, partial [Sphingobacteriaceae bacterium]
CPRVMEAFIREELIPERDEDHSLLDKMVYNGKVLYLMDELMPKLDDTVKIGYTAAQAQWCKDYEADIWAYFIDDNLLFETDYLKIQKFLTDAPFTPGVGQGNESAPKLGVWIGWQMVRKYMDKHPEVTLKQLLAQTDAQQLLKESKYKPK